MRFLLSHDAVESNLSAFSVGKSDSNITVFFDASL